MRRRARAAAILLGALCTGSCVPEAEVAVAVHLPRAASEAAWIELGAVPGNCPSAASLLSGLPLGAVAARVAFPRDSTRPPTFGALPREHWAFVATARDASCGVVAVGCKSVDLAHTREVDIQLLAVGGTPEGRCTEGLVCQYAHCVGIPGAGVASGTGCSLDVRSGGSLADPLSVDSAARILAAAPSITAVDGAFAIGTADATETADRFRLRLTRAGGDTPATPPLEDAVTPCQGTVSLDGLSLADLGDGRILEARRGPGCNPTALTISEITGSSRRTRFVANLASGARLAPRALTREASTGRVYLASAGGTGVRLTGVDAASLGADVTGIPSGLTAHVDLASTATSTLWLARDGAGRSVAGLVRGAASQAVLVPEGTLAVASRGTGFEVLSVDSSGLARLHTLDRAGATTHTVDLGSPGIPAPTASSPTSGAVVARGDFSVAVIGAAGDVWVTSRWTLEAPEIPNVWRRLSDSLPLARRRRDGAVSVAAASDRVAVVWGTSARPTPDDVPFGYAVLGCEPRSP